MANKRIQDLDLISSLSGDEQFAVDDPAQTYRATIAQILAYTKTGLYPVVQNKSANYTVLETDDFLTGDSSGGAFTFTLPSAAAVIGKTFTFKKVGTGVLALTIARAGSDTIDGATSIVLYLQNESVSIISSASGVWRIKDAQGMRRQYLVAQGHILQGAVSTRSSSPTVMGAFAGAAGIAGPVVDDAGIGGTLQTTDANNYVFTVNDLLPGKYRVRIGGLPIQVANGFIGEVCINDGTSSRGHQSFYHDAGGAPYWPISLEAEFAYAAVGNVSFQVFGRTDTTAISIAQVDAAAKVTFKIERIE